jgi:AraC-like DNA-binding protein
MNESRPISGPGSRIWEPTPTTNIQFRGLRLMHGGPVAMILPEHEHVETQIQTRFCPKVDGIGLEPYRSSLYAPGQPHRGGVGDNWEVIVMLLDSQLMSEAADELFYRDRFSIKPFHVQCSRTVEQLNEAVRGEFRSPHGPSLFYLESISHVMAGYILRHHAVTDAQRTIRGRFSSTQIQRLERFIDERLSTEFGINDLAALVKLGSQRFTERFRLTTGMSPWQFVQARRVQRAQLLLADRKTALAEIALNVGFSSQSHFTNVFRRAVGITPKAYRDHCPRNKRS